MKKKLLCVTFFGIVAFFSSSKRFKLVNCRINCLPYFNSLYEYEMAFQTTEDNFSSWKCAITHGKTGSRHIGHSAGQFYPMRLTRQTWLLLTATFLHRWITLWLSSALVYENVSKNDLMNGLRQKGKIFLEWYSWFTRKIGKIYHNRRSIL